MMITFNSLSNLKSIVVLFAFPLSLLLACGSANQRDLSTSLTVSKPTILEPQRPKEGERPNRENQVRESQLFRRFHTSPTARLVSKVQDDHGNSPRSRSHSIRVGVLLPLSGEMSAWGRAIQTSLNRVVGHLKGITLHYADTAGEPSLAVSAIDAWRDHNQSSRDHIDLIIGPISPYVASAVAQRVQWYELPWFPLGSLPQVLRNSFTISWRIEASDEARALGELICQRSSTPVSLLLDESPRAQLFMRIARRALRRCGIREPRLLLIRQTSMGAADESSLKKVTQALSNSQERESVVITSLRGALLVHVLTEYQRELKTTSRDPKRKRMLLYAGLGAQELLDRSTFKSIRVHALDREKLSQLGVRYLKDTPQASSIELALFDLLYWVSQARGVAPQLSLMKALRERPIHQGVWGERRFESGRLSPPRLYLIRR